MLVVGTASNQMHVFDIATGSISKWSKEYSAQLPKRFLDMPGHITGISFQPLKPGHSRDPTESIPCIVCTPAAFAYVDFAIPPTSQLSESAASEQDAEGGKRKRRAQKPAPAPHQSDPLTSALTSKHALHASGTGDNFRIISFDDACLGMSYLSPESVLLVECPWSQVLRNFPTPLFRHRYGT